MDDRPEGYEYPEAVRFAIQQDVLHAYRAAADFLNFNETDVLLLQHEFGIFGGPGGSHVLTLLHELRMPIVTTFHTILREPSPEQERVLREVATLSDRVVAISRRGAEFLRTIYGVPADKVAVIDHGVPDVPFTDPNYFKDQFGVENRIVLLTFGLLGPNKGIEYVIEALPSIVGREPRVTYLVFGSTHPHVRRTEGESYRLGLERRARELGVGDHVVFHDRFLSEEELTRCIGAADIYLTPYLGREQISSGALSYAVGAGKAVVSTPYWHAEELLAEGRGSLVPFRNAGAIADAVIRLLDEEGERHAMRKRAYLHARGMTWPEVGGRYRNELDHAVRERTRRPRQVYQAPAVTHRPGYLPPLNCDHLRRLTDDTGIFEHAVFTVPNRGEGYTTDDNARGLLVAHLFEEAGHPPPDPWRDLAAIYLGFLWHAFDPASGRFRNRLGFDRVWRDAEGSADCHGRSVWALGTLVGRTSREDLRGSAIRLLQAATPALEKLESPRAVALSLLGLTAYAQRFPEDRAILETRRGMVRRLVRWYGMVQDRDWEWFEDRLTYANARIPHALLEGGRSLSDPLAETVGIRSLEWLMRIQTSQRGSLLPIGTRGFYRRDGARARFDQQPLEASATVSACLSAYRLTGDERWKMQARKAFDWFLGRNDLGLSLHDPATGGCRDGLHPDRANENQGAESTLAFLQALLELQIADGLSTNLGQEPEPSLQTRPDWPRQAASERDLHAGKAGDGDHDGQRNGQRPSGGEADRG